MRILYIGSGSVWKSHQSRRKSVENAVFLHKNVSLSGTGSTFQRWIPIQVPKNRSESNVADLGPLQPWNISKREERERAQNEEIPCN